MYVMHNTLHKYSDRKADVNSSNFSVTAKHMNTINFKSTRLQCKLNFCNPLYVDLFGLRQKMMNISCTRHIFITTGFSSVHYYHQISTDSSKLQRSLSQNCNKGQVHNIKIGLTKTNISARQQIKHKSLHRLFVINRCRICGNATFSWITAIVLKSIQTDEESLHISVIDSPKERSNWRGISTHFSQR